MRVIKKWQLVLLMPVFLLARRAAVDADRCGCREHFLFSHFRRRPRNRLTSQLTINRPIIPVITRHRRERERVRERERENERQRVATLSESCSFPCVFFYADHSLCILLSFSPVLSLATLWCVCVSPFGRKKGARRAVVAQPTKQVRSRQWSLLS